MIYNSNNNNCNTSIAYILKYARSEVQQTKSFGVIINGERQKSSLEHESAKYLR